MALVGGDIHQARPGPPSAVGAAAAAAFAAVLLRVVGVEGTQALQGGGVHVHLAVEQPAAGVAGQDSGMAGMEVQRR